MARRGGAAGALWLLVTACPAEQPAVGAPPPAAPEKAAEDPDTARRRAAREAEKKGEEEARAALAARIDELTVLPGKIPGKLDKACAGMLAAYDGFMRLVLSGDQKTKWETGGNEMQLAVFRKECLKRNPATAACQQHALEKAPPELEPHLAELMRRCAEKHGASTEGSRPPGR